jgi:hypothetical protein
MDAIPYRIFQRCYIHVPLSQFQPLEAPLTLVCIEFIRNFRVLPHFDYKPTQRTSGLSVSVSTSSTLVSRFRR